MIAPRCGKSNARFSNASAIHQLVGLAVIADLCVQGTDDRRFAQAAAHLRQQFRDLDSWDRRLIFAKGPPVGRPGLGSHVSN